MGVRKRADLLEIKEISACLFAAVDVKVVELYFAFFLEDERQDFAVGMPGQKRKRGVDVLVGTIACTEKLLAFAALQVFEPKSDFALVVADIGDVFPVRADARLRESAVFLVFQWHHVFGLVGHKCLVTSLVEREPLIEQFLVFLARHIKQCLAHVARVFGQGEDVVERLAAVFFVDEVPKRVTRNLRVVVLQMVDFLVVARHDAALQLGFLVAVPIAGDVGHEAVAEPLRDVVAIRTADLRPDRDAVHHLAEQQARDALADLRLEVGVVAVEVENHLRADDFGDAACVAVFLFLKVDVALLEVALAVEHDELDFLSETAVEAGFEARNLVFGVGLGIFGQIVAALVEIHVEVVVRVVRPMEVAVLHAVLPERHVHAVVELGISHRHQGHKQQKQERVFLFRGH